LGDIVEFSKKLIGSTTSTLILAVISEKDRHGYEIVQRVNQLSNGAFQWREGTVYPALHRLEKQGLIAGQWCLATSGRQRRVYALTPHGRDELSRQEQEWSVFSSSVNRVLEGCYAT
jgi:PadR family transcriptional regulator PadR